jgi:uncharacterized protein (TIGR02145 family)
VTIGNQEWLAENLDWKWNGLQLGNHGESATIQLANYYNYDEATYGINGNKYGLLYNHKAVEYLESNKNTMLPDGWRVPSQNDYLVLVDFIGADIAGTKLKSRTGWNNEGNGTDDYNYSAVPSGYDWNGNFGNIGNRGQYWTKTTSPSSGDSRCYCIYFSYNRTDLLFELDGPPLYVSLRLVKDVT